MARPNKYRAKRTPYNGVTYASKAEAKRAAELDKVDAWWWVGQPKFRLGCPENVYVADFLVVTKDAIKGGGVRVEDVKGMETATFKRNKRLWKKYGPCDLVILKRKGNGWTTETITPGTETETKTPNSGR